MPSAKRLWVLFFFQLHVLCGTAQPHFLATATINGNDLQVKIKAVGGPITCGWSVFEFFFRNPDAAPNADTEFDAATITMNSTDFPGLSIPYNGSNLQGAETGYNNYWFGAPFNPPTATRTYNQNQEYLVCTISLSTSPSGFDFEMCHNEPYFTPHYLALTNEDGTDMTNLTGTNKFYGPDTIICNPNCPVTTDGNNHILPLNGAQPVELMDFQARKHQESAARLDWRTASEVNFNYFEIHRQHPDGHWEFIGSVPGKAWTGEGAAYTFYDYSPPRETVYYRLKMVDNDGTFAHSPIRSVAFEPENAMRVFPNPSSGVLHLAFDDDMRKEQLIVELLDWAGRVVLQKQVAVLPGGSETIGLGEYALPGGVYLLRAHSVYSGFEFRKNVVVLD